MLDKVNSTLMFKKLKLFFLQNDVLKAGLSMFSSEERSPGNEGQGTSGIEN